MPPPRRSSARRHPAAPAVQALRGGVRMIPAVELRDVSWGPPKGQDILSGLGFAVPQGQIMAICGAYGAGKSSLLRLIYRHHAPRSGVVRVLGQDLWQSRATQIARNVAAVLQEQPTDFALTARQIVALGRLPHRRGWRAGLSLADDGDAGIVGAAMERMHLTALADRAFGTLSGGERQRVMVARALAQEPQVIVLDEPTNHLDIRHQLELLALLRGLGLTVIATLHDLTLAAGFADRILVLAEGRILADGPPDQALTEATLAHAFHVKARIDHSGHAPRFAFHL